MSEIAKIAFFVPFYPRPRDVRANEFAVFGSRPPPTTTTSEPQCTPATLPGIMFIVLYSLLTSLHHNPLKTPFTILVERPIPYTPTPPLQTEPTNR